METIIFKAKVLRVKSKYDYQEVVLSKGGFLFQNSIEIKGCDKDIASLIKKTFWGRSKSEIELHVIGGYVVKIYLDGVLLCERTDENYPGGLKKILKNEKQHSLLFEEKFLQWLLSYPKKENVETEVFAFKDVVLRAYVGACLDKVKTLGKWDDDLYQRRCSLFVDLMHLIEIFGTKFWEVISWPNVLNYSETAFFLPNHVKDKIIKSIALEKVDEQIVAYLFCWLGDFSQIFKYDQTCLDRYLRSRKSVFSYRRVDRLLLIDYNDDLKLCQPWDEMPNFVLKEPLSQPEFKFYLSKQNW